MQKNNRHEKAPSAPTLEAHEAERQSIRKNVMTNNSTAVTPDNLPTLIHSGHRVVTTALLAKLYGTDDVRIRQNYKRNVMRFEQGKHYYKLEGDALKALKEKVSGGYSVESDGVDGPTMGVISRSKSMMLWTERGAARHAKMLETEKAWEVFEKLEDSYFGKAVAPHAALPAPINYTLIGTTIGSDGFHCLSAVIDGKINRLDKRARQSVRMHIWSQVHKAFSVVSAQDIPADQLDSARNFIAAYVLDGEWLPKKEESGIHLSQMEAQHLYLLMSRFAAMSRHKESMLSAARALDSRPLMEFFDQLTEGGSSFAHLDQRRDELYEIYQSLGCKGGYSWSMSA